MYIHAFESVIKREHPWVHGVWTTENLATGSWGVYWETPLEDDLESFSFEVQARDLRDMDNPTRCVLAMLKLKLEAIEVEHWQQLEPWLPYVEEYL